MSRRKPDSQEPQSSPDAPCSGVAPDPGKRSAVYTLASGSHAGQAILVSAGEQRAYPDGIRADLYEGDKKVQTLAKYSDGKEPGTWHWS